MRSSLGRPDWEQRAATLRIRHQAWIDGRPVDPASGTTFDCHSPIDGRLIAKVAACDAADVDRAVAAARRAFRDGRWARLAPTERKRILLRFADLIRANLEELALLETLDMGKPIANALAVDVPYAADCIAYYAECIDKLYGEVVPTAPTDHVTIRHEPLGVVAAVVPWNYPLLMASWKIAPALAAGNSVILKPAEQSPLTALFLGELASTAGVPDGVFNVVPGFGETAGRALGLHPDVDMVAFTGSTEVGKLFLKYAGESNMKRVSLECGGKSPHIILPDCPDLDAAAEAVAWGIFYNQGEACNAGSRLIVHESLHETFLERVIAATRAIRVGHPLDPATQLGALVDRRHMERVLGYIDLGHQEGARLRLGGNRVLAETGGFYVEPTIFDNVRNSMRIAQEEIFGPVLVVLTFREEEEALAIANDTIYGLAGAVWTADVNRVHRFADAIKAGVVWVNCFDRANLASPFGGFKQSGFGRDKSIHAIEKYTDMKVTWLALNS